MRSPIAARVQKHREHLRESGLRPLQIWIPDTYKKGFFEECRRQSKLVAKDVQEKEILNIINEDADFEGWS